MQKSIFCGIRKLKLIGIIFLVSLQIVGVFLVARPVHAQTDGAITAAYNAKWSWELIGDALLSGALGGLMEGASYFMRKLAYDTAKFVASGGKGQGALAFKDGFGSYIEGVSKDMGMTMVEEFAKGTLGLSICMPPDIRQQINLALGFSSIYGEGGPQPSCKWSDFKNNWDPEGNLGAMYGSDGLSERFAASLSVTEGDFGVALQTQSAIDKIVNDAVNGAINERLEGSGFKPVKDFISGNIKTPSDIVGEETKSLTAKNQGAMSAEQIAGIYGSGSLQIIPSALSVFANTLVGSLLENLLTKGLLPTDGESDVVDFYASTINTNRQAAERAFSFLISGIPQRSLSAYNVVTEYSSCPSNPGLNNCVMDLGLVAAINRATAGEPVTIAEALKDGTMLNPNYKLIPPSNIVKNTDPNCYTDAYCYSNIQKLRKARILPLGFEIAVSRSSPDNSWTLGEVVTGFTECPLEGESYDRTEYPFCHLIDPNWIIKAPEARCEAGVNGPLLATPLSAERKYECADFSTCLAKDESGSCVSYGYCQQEKNVWHIPGQSCPSYYNTCKTYTSKDGEYNSYLSRTLDYGTCNVESVGCTAYSIEQKDGQWQKSSSVDISKKADLTDGRQQVVYFNEKVTDCPSTEEGATLFVASSTAQKVYLKKAPDYLGCYDTNPSTQEIDWPITKADLQLLSNTPESCKNFAGVCTPEEVSCQSYAPKDGSTVVTGVIGNNYCPAQCVGYETFKQEKTNFEADKFPLYFIPSTGQSCSSQYAGCDEFTNISDINGEKLEYFTDLKYCQQPKVDNAKTFYSWEGSESQGYVLKKHNLAVIDPTLASEITTVSLGLVEGFGVGSPKYSNSYVGDILSNVLLCNQENYNILIDNPYNPNAAHPDCRALYDSSGNIYYRLLEKTVTVSDQCQKYRKTDSQMKVDDYYTGKGETYCTSHHGSWSESKCSICYNGGEYEKNQDGVGSCMYYSIPSEAGSCPANANSCRMYIGNTGNNIHEVYSTSFEPINNEAGSLDKAKDGWSGTTIKVVPEATQVGLYSLNSDGDFKYTFPVGSIKKGIHYELSFWARGEPQGITVDMGNTYNNVTYEFTKDPLTQASIPAPITLEWQQYTLGPVLMGEMYDEVLGKLYTAQLEFNSNKKIFIDNVRLVSLGNDVDDYIPLIKDSWKTPEGYEVSLSCDTTPLDAYPGEYLGCREYVEAQGTQYEKTIQITGFEKLCRAEAVGCMPLVDTGNTDATNNENAKYGVVYNALCKKGTKSSANATVCEADMGDKKYSCTYKKGETSCFVEEPIFMPSLGQEYSLEPKHYEIAEDNSGGYFIYNTKMKSESSGWYDVHYPIYALNIKEVDALYIVTSTVIVPEDSETRYLAVQEKYLSSEQYMGCEKVGREEHILPGEGQGAYTFTDTYVLNNPSNYTEALCVQEQVGCQQYKNDNNVLFFKDPTQAGASLCSYKSEAMVNGIKSSGWFMDGIGKCSNGGNLCKGTQDCAVGGTCENVDLQPCYPQYIQPTHEFGLWSNASVNYKDFVGLCTTENDGCTELIDPADTSGYPDGKPYYVINDDRLIAKTGECDGKASQKEGCVLFNMTENPNRIYDSQTTYTNSEEKNYDLVPIVTVDSTQGDSNLLLKVNRDRECSEWLSCTSWQESWDSEGTPLNVCDDFKSCNKLAPDGDCADDGWVNSEQDTTRLTQERYISRGVSWSDPDYSGYSLYNKYNPSNYVYLVFPGEEISYLAYEMDDQIFENNKSKGCFEPPKEDGQVCGIDDKGRCFKEKCLYPIDGVFEDKPLDTPSNPNANPAEKDDRIKKNISKMMDKLIPGTCKAYPEQTSPFNALIAVENPADVMHGKNASGDDLGRKEYKTPYQQYQNAHICQLNEDVTENSEIQDCACEYLKLEYKDGTTDYWHVDDAQDITKDGVCSGGGDNAGMACDKDSECGDNGIGICNKLVKKGTFYGLKGLCMEYDLSRPLGPYQNSKEIYNSFACLTWLPIQVSASVVDMYNMDIQAGYYPTAEYDSPGNDGRVYCTQTTSFGKGYYDKNISFNIISGQWILKPPFDSIFGVNNIVLWNSGGEDYQYHEVFNVNTSEYDKGVDTGFVGGFEGMLWKESLYENLMYSGTKDALYPTMQTWAWRNIAPNARVMRADYVSGKNANYYHDFDGSVINKSHVAVVYNFALRGDQLDNHGAGDSGTLLHPPRLWNLGSHTYNVNEATINNKQYNYIMESKTGLTVESDIFHAETSAFSPEFLPTNEYIYHDAEFEQNINEQNINSIYFVPLLYPGGAEGANPPTLTSEFRIDFNSLRLLQETGENPILGKEVNYVAGDVFISYGGSKGSYMVNYMLQNDGGAMSNCTNGIGSFCNYDVNAAFSKSMPYGNVWANYKENVETLEERNKIYRRYVALYYYIKGFQPNGAHTFDFHDSSGAKLTLPLKEDGQHDNRDPFTTDCIQSSGNNWVAIGLDFNKSGEFLGYISRYCDGEYNEGGDGGGIRFATIAEMADTCTDMISVYDDSQEITGNSNKAWTDRVWQNAKNTWPGTTVGKSLTLGTPRVPYGSLTSPDVVLNQENLINYDPLTDITISYFGFPETSFGFPYSCNGGSTIKSDSKYMFDNSFSCDGWIPASEDNGEIQKISDGKALLNNLFNAYYAEVDAILKEVIIPTSTVLYEDKAGINLGETKPPQIYSINPVLCAVPEENKCYVGEKDNITVDNRNYNDKISYDGTGVTIDDLNGGGIDPMIYTGSHKTTVKFFAWADDNRMPIRRVLVNWGDGKVSNDNRTGAYKNRKPYCEGGDVGRCDNQKALSTISQLTCKMDIEQCENYASVIYKNDSSDFTCKTGDLHFGDSTRACDNKFFEFTHVYSCSQADIDNPSCIGDKCVKSLSEIQANDGGIFPDDASALEAYERLKEYSLDGSDEVCIFKPKVQVLDNWGWCNGTCSGNGCYNHVKTGEVNGVEFFDDQCNPNLDYDSWTKFKGAIIVIPS